MVLNTKTIEHNQANNVQFYCKNDTTDNVQDVTVGKTAY